MRQWRLASVVQTVVTRDDRALSITVYEVPPRWIVGCLETVGGKVGAPPGGNMDALRAVLEDHAHEALEASSLPEALALGESYAKWWQGSRASHFVCDCDRIPKA
jgi:hypothetical protein